ATATSCQSHIRSVAANGWADCCLGLFALSNTPAKSRRPLAAATAAPGPASSRVRYATAPQSASWSPSLSPPEGTQEAVQVAITSMHELNREMPSAHSAQSRTPHPAAPGHDAE